MKLDLRVVIARPLNWTFPGVAIPGTPGSPGAPGSVWRNGTGAPSNALGINGDYYLDAATGDVYLKAAGAYAAVANIKGNPGLTGPAVPLGNANPLGPGTATPGVDTSASRQDHVHPMPGAADVGADPAGSASAAQVAAIAAAAADATTKANAAQAAAEGTAAGALAAHVAAADPHPAYTTEAEAAAVAPVQSVAGRTGHVTLAAADVAGLGTAATLNVGTTAGTVAAGNALPIPHSLLHALGASDALTPKTLFDILNDAVTIQAAVFAETALNTQGKGVVFYKSRTPGEESMIYGLLTPSEGNPSQVTLVNGNTAEKIAVVHDKTNAAENRRITDALAGQVDVGYHGFEYLLPGQSITLRYDSLANRWKKYRNGIPRMVLVEVPGNTWMDVPGNYWACVVLCVGAGGGGGSGRKGAATENNKGGGGGSSGGWSLSVFSNALALPAGVTLTSLGMNCGFGGAGGAARTADSTSGSNGSSGNPCRVWCEFSGGYNPVNVGYATGGNAGGGGTTAVGTAGAAPTGSLFPGLAGGAGGASPSVLAATSAQALAGGGGGGGAADTGSATAGAAGSSSGNLLLGPVSGTGGGVGSNGGNGVALWSIGGGGGGGGGGSITGNAGNGGNGLRGGGGGGGGGARNGVGNSGAGGNGGNGVILMLWFHLY